MQRREYLKSIAAGAGLAGAGISLTTSGAEAMGTASSSSIDTTLPMEMWSSFTRPHGENPLIKANVQGTFDANGAAAAHHIVDGDTVHYLWAGYNSSTGEWKIGRSYAPTSDPLNLTRSSANPIVGPGPSGAWDEAGAEYPSPFYNPADDTYYAYYTGDDSNGLRQIGLLKQGADWDTWSKSSANPVIQATGSGYRSGEVGWQDVAVVGDTIHIVYTADDGSTNGMALAHATAPTSDPTNISQDPNNPILTPGDIPWASTELREAGVWRGPDGYIHIPYAGEDTDWYGGHMRVDETLSEWTTSDLEQNPDNPLWAAAPSGWEHPDFLTPVPLRINDTYYLIYAAGAATPYQTGVMTAPAPTEFDSSKHSEAATWNTQSSGQFVDHETADGQLTAGQQFDFEQDRLSNVTNVTGSLSLAIGTDAKNDYFAAKSDSGSGLANSNYAWHRFETPGYPYTTKGRVAGWVKTTNDGTDSNAGTGFIAIDESSGAYVRAVINPNSTTNPALYDDANNGLGNGSWSPSWNTYYWLEFIPDLPNNAYEIVAYDAPGGTKLGSASGSYSGLSDYALGMISYKNNAGYFDSPWVIVEGVRGSWRGGRREFTDDVLPDSFETTNETVVGSGSDIRRARLHSDPDGDGTFEETSNWFNLDGTTKAISGLSSKTRRIEAEVEMEASDATAIRPGIDGLDWDFDIVGESDSLTPLADLTPSDPLAEQPDGVSIYSYPTATEIVSRYQPVIDVSAVDTPPSKVYAWAATKKGEDRNMVCYWLYWPNGSPVGTQDWEPIYVEYEPSTQSVDRVHYDTYTYLLATDTDPPLTNETQPKFEVTSKWHSLRPTKSVEEASTPSLADLHGPYPAQIGEAWDISRSAAVDPWVAVKRGHWHDTYAGVSPEAYIAKIWKGIDWADMPTRST